MIVVLRLLPLQCHGGHGPAARGRTTPSEDHQTLWRTGVAMDSDLNIYDAEHVCTGHPRMSKQEWTAIYKEAWSLYYTPRSSNCSP